MVDLNFFYLLSGFMYFIFKLPYIYKSTCLWWSWRQFSKKMNDRWNKCSVGIWVICYTQSLLFRWETFPSFCQLYKGKGGPKGGSTIKIPWLCTKKRRQSPKVKHNSFVWICPVLVICQPDYRAIRIVTVRNYIPLGIFFRVLPKLTAFFSSLFLWPICCDSN